MCFLCTENVALLYSIVLFCYVMFTTFTLIAVRYRILMLMLQMLHAFRILIPLWRKWAWWNTVLLYRPNPKKQNPKSIRKWYLICLLHCYWKYLNIIKYKWQGKMYLNLKWINHEMRIWLLIWGLVNRFSSVLTQYWLYKCFTYLIFMWNSCNKLFTLFICINILNKISLKNGF